MSFLAETDDRMIRMNSFQTLENFIQHPNKEKIVILRHDVDRLPSNALVIAKIEKDASVKASYYFRIVKESYDEDIIRQIVEMGHEVGYHYENLSEISKENPQISQIDADLRISHRRTQTRTDIYPADFAGQKESSLREKKSLEINSLNWLFVILRGI